MDSIGSSYDGIMMSGSPIHFQYCNISPSLCPVASVEVTIADGFGDLNRFYLFL